MWDNKAPNSALLPKSVTAAGCPAGRADDAVTARVRLPNRRACETFDVEVAGLRYTCTFSRFPSGQIGELISNQKNNSSADTAAERPQ